MAHDPISPELAARLTAAEATRADFHHAVDAWLGGAAEPHWGDWAFRLSNDLALVLVYADGLDGGMGGIGRPGVAQPGGGWISGPSR
jgi:hypothetical protein